MPPIVADGPSGPLLCLLETEARRGVLEVGVHRPPLVGSLTLQPSSVPVIIGHRGAPGYLPDHTLEGYTLAVEQGADAIEPDLVITLDGALIARHENELSGTTDVATRFPDRRKQKIVDGTPVDGWFAEDFTLAEIRTLRARQPWPDRPRNHDGAYLIPTIDEVFELAERLGAARGRPVMVVPETKHPSYFQALGRPLEPALLAAMARHPEIPVVVQSFELSNLGAFEGHGGRLFLVGAPSSTLPGDTRTYGEVLADLPGLRAKVEYLGVPRELVWGPDGPTDFITRAHAAGLKVWIWTFRAERPGAHWGGDIVRELQAFRGLGADGLFVDQPDLGVRAR